MIYNLLEAIRIAAHLLMPLMPQTSAEALRRLSCEDEAASDDLKGICAWGLLAGGQPVEKGEPLFPRLAKTPRAISAICCLDVRAWPQRSMPFCFKTPPSC